MIETGSNRPFRQARMAALVITLALALLAGPASAQAPSAPARPKVGLALSGGGARGLAHIGVLQVLEEMGVPVDMVAGTSMGSIVGGLYASGYTPAQITAIVEQMDWKDSFTSAPARRLLRYDQKDESLRYLFEVGVGQGTINLPAGLISGYKLTAVLTRLCLPVAHVTDFDRLPIPFRAVATDITNGDTVVLGQGNLALAMRASMSLPSIFPPFEIDGRLLVDGGVTQNLPVETVRAMGADIIIAVNVSTPLRPRNKINDFIDVMDQTLSLSMIKSTDRQAALADLVITPELERFANTDFDKADELRALGEQAARAQAQAILAQAAARGVALGQGPRPGLLPLKTVTVALVTVEGSQTYLNEVRRLTPYQPGQVVNTAELDQAVQRIYGLGSLESVSYEVVPRPDGQSEVRFLLKEKRLGLAASRMGVRLGFNSDRTDLMELHFNFRRPNVFFSGAYGELDVFLGRSYGAAARLVIPDQPLDGFLLRPTVFYSSRLHDIYQNRQIRAQFTVDTWGAGVEAGFFLGTHGEFTVGYWAEHNTLSPRIITTAFDETSDTLSGLRFTLRLDTLDRKPYPTRGFTSDLVGFRMLRDLLSDVDYTSVSWRASLALPLSERQTLEPNWTLASALNTNPPSSKVVFLGGYPDFWGYAFEEFFGNDVARLQLLYRYRLTQRIYIQAAGNVGQVWDNLDQADREWNRLRWGGGAGLAFDTPLGPLETALGLGEQGRTNIYFVFGYWF